MSQVPPSSGRDFSEVFSDFLHGVAKFLLTFGALVSVICIGLLIYTCTVVKGGDANVAQALTNVGVMRTALIAGLLGLGVGATYLFWGEEILGAVQLIGAGILYFAPLFLPSMIGAESNRVTQAAFEALQTGGAIYGVLALGVLVVDIGIRVKDRAKQGVKADQLRYGKGIKEEADRQNVFLGKCWQLPFCRKFVRERCPIYHSKRTCWKEKVGCMCEEEVIRNAMENKPIPKDALLAANYIPRNNRLTLDQKKERCRSCVIYNEHQKQKYKAILPLVLLGFVGFYLLMRGPLLAMTAGLVTSFNQILGKATLRDPRGFAVPTAFAELLLICLLVVALAYVLRLVEYLIFKLKV